MFSHTKKLKRYVVPWFCLLAVLFLAGVASAAPHESALNQSAYNQTDDQFVPAVYTFEGPYLPKVLDTAARTIQACLCEGMVSYFEFKQFEGLTDPWYHLSIYFGDSYPGSITPNHWELIRFQNASLPKALTEAAEYVDGCQCQEYVMNVAYERIYFASDSVAPQHIVYLAIGSPLSDEK